MEVLSISAKEVMINDQIRAKEVRVIDSDGSQLGILPLAEALKLAYGKDLDLVEISPNSAPPVCRVMDYGKFRFERDKKERKRKRNSRRSILRKFSFPAGSIRMILKLSSNMHAAFLTMETKSRSA